MVPIWSRWPTSLLYCRPTPSQAGVRHRTEPDFEHLQRELKQHKHLTLQPLREEYRGQERGGYGYSRYCDLYRQCARSGTRSCVAGTERGPNTPRRERSPSTRQDHPQICPHLQLASRILMQQEA